MKTIFLFLSTVLWTFSLNAQCPDIVHIPDGNLKQSILLWNDNNNDGEICRDEALAVDELSISQGVQDITGIEAFENITYLFLENNTVTSLDLSQFEKLTSVAFFEANGLTNLNLENPALNDVDLNGLAGLDFIDFSKNPKLKLINVAQYGVGFGINVANGYVGKRISIGEYQNDICIQVDQNIPFVDAGDMYYDSSYQGTVINSSFPDNINIFAQTEPCVTTCDNPLTFSKDIFNAIATTYDTDNDDKICQDEADLVEEFFLQLYYHKNSTGDLITYNFNGLNNLKNLKKLTTSTFEGIYYPGDIDFYPYYFSNPVPLSGLNKLEYFNNSSIGDFGDKMVDFTDNPKLSTYISTDNSISVINFDQSQVPLLSTLDLSNNKITEVDLSQSMNLTNVNLSDNWLKTANIANGNNQNMLVDFTSNPLLKCIEHDADFDPSSNANWKKDDTAIWSTSCALRLVEYYSKIENNNGYVYWTADNEFNNVEYYNIYRSSSKNPEYTKIGRVESVSSNVKIGKTTEATYSYTDTNVTETEGQDVVYLVEAVNYDGTSTTFERVEGTLPIILKSFNVETRLNNAIINWATATEINNSHFNVQRSFDGQDFETIGEVAGKGNSNDGQSYSFKDFNVGQNYSTVYYRLEQVDFDGTTETFDAQSVTFKNNNSFSIYPNPSTTGKSVTLNGENIKSVAIYNVVGKQILQKNYNDQSSINLDTSVLVQGIYVIVINGTQKQKLIIQ